MNLDLLADVVSPTEYHEAFRGWLAETEQAGLVQRESSAEVYEHMWAALTAWAVGDGLRLADIRASDLESFLASRGGPNDLSARFSKRLLRFVDRVTSEPSTANPASHIKAYRSNEEAIHAKAIHLVKLGALEPVPVQSNHR